MLARKDQLWRARSEAIRILDPQLLNQRSNLRGRCIGTKNVSGDTPQRVARTNDIRTAAPGALGASRSHSA